MSRSLSLTAFLALRRGQGDIPYTAPARPALREDQALVWMHCPDLAHLDGVPALVEALAADDNDAHVLVTCGTDPAGHEGLVAGVTYLPAPPEYRQPVRAFLEAIRPDLMIWQDGHLRPVLVHESRGRAFARILVDLRHDSQMLDGPGWMPGAAGALVDSFDHAFVVDHLAAQKLAKLGLPDDLIEVTGALESLPPAPPCHERDRQDMAEAVGTRPVWLAADLPMAELADVIAAHRHAIRAAHRLLLIIAPARMEDIDPMMDRLQASGLSVASRWDGEEPDEHTEVYLADGPGEMGLWLRLSPVTYLGGTLSGESQRHPFEAAALGTAIIHGLRTGAHADVFARLTGAGAARAVHQGQNLAHAVEALLAADRCATMVEAAWEVSTAGAVTANRLADLIRKRLPLRMTDDARS